MQRLPLRLVAIALISISPVLPLAKLIFTSFAVGKIAEFHTHAVATALKDSVVGALTAAFLLTPVCLLVAVSVGLLSLRWRLLAAICAGMVSLSCASPLCAKFSSDVLSCTAGLLGFEFWGGGIVAIHALWKTLPILLLLLLVALGPVKSRAETAVNSGQTWVGHALLFLPRYLSGRAVLVFWLLFSFSLSYGGSGSTIDPKFRPLPSLIADRESFVDSRLCISTASSLLALVALFAVVPTVFLRPHKPDGDNLIEPPKKRRHSHRILTLFLWPLSVVPVVLPLLLTGYCFLMAAKEPVPRTDSGFPLSLLAKQMLCALAAGVGALLIALPAALDLARNQWKGNSIPQWLPLLVCLPLLIPEISLADATREQVGMFLDCCRSDVVDALMLVSVSTVRSVPLAFLLSFACLSARGFKREEAAWNLGASYSRVWWWITAPDLIPVMLLCVCMGAMVHFSGYYFHSYLSTSTTFTTWLVNTYSSYSTPATWLAQGCALLMFLGITFVGVAAMAKSLWNVPEHHA